MNFVTLKTLRLLTDADLADVALRWAARDPEQFLVLCQDVLDAKEAGDNASPDKKSLGELLERPIPMNARYAVEVPRAKKDGSREFMLQTDYQNVFFDEPLLWALQNVYNNSNQRVTAIRYIREQLNLGLKEAKDLHDWLVENGWVTQNGSF